MIKEAKGWVRISSVGYPEGVYPGVGGKPGIRFEGVPRRTRKEVSNTRRGLSAEEVETTTTKGELLVEERAGALRQPGR